MGSFATCVSVAIAAVVLAGATLSSPALAQSDPSHKGSLALPMPTAPVPAETATPPQAAPTEDVHSRSAHHTLKLDLPSAPRTEAEAGNSPLQGAGPPQGNRPDVAAAPGAGPLVMSPLQGAGPVSAREMLLGSASTLGTR